MTFGHATADPRVSIVVVNWNTQALLLRLLGQLLPPEGTPIPAEVVVVDNASTDDSVASARASYPDATILEEPSNGGFAKGVNRGISAARSEWILLLNTDAEIDWAALQQFLAEARGVPSGGVFGPRIVDEHGAVQSSAWNRHSLLRRFFDAIGLARRLDRQPPSTVPKQVGCVSGCVFLIRRGALETTGGLDERFFMYFEEADLCERMRRAGFGVHYLPGTSFMHAGGLSAEQAARRSFLVFRESCLLYHAAWHGRLATEWVRACLLLGSVLRWAATCLGFGPGRRRKLHWAAMAMLARPRLVARLCARQRQVPAVEPTLQKSPLGQEPASQQ